MTDLTLSSNASPTLHRNKAFPNPAHGGSTPLAAQQSTKKTLNNNKQQQKQSITIEHNKTINSAWYGLEGESTRKINIEISSLLLQLKTIDKHHETINSNLQQQQKSASLLADHRQSKQPALTLFADSQNLNYIPKSRNCRKISLRPFQHAQGTNGRILNLFQCSNWNSLLEFE